MFGTIVKHNRECVELIPVNKFLKKVKEHYIVDKVELSENNDGVYLWHGGNDWTLISWNGLASDMEWFDEAEVVTDKNENEKVMVWLNLD